MAGNSYYWTVLEGSVSQWLHAGGLHMTKPMAIGDGNGNERGWLDENLGSD